MLCSPVKILFSISIDFFHHHTVKQEEKEDCEHNNTSSSDESSPSTPPPALKNIEAASAADSPPLARAPNPSPPHSARVTSVGLTQHPFNSDELESTIIIGESFEIYVAQGIFEFSIVHLTILFSSQFFLSEKREDFRIDEI